MKESSRTKVTLGRQVKSTPWRVRPAHKVILGEAKAEHLSQIEEGERDR